MEKHRSGYMQEYTRPPHPTCEEPGCERKVKLEVLTFEGTPIGRYCQSDGVKTLREHNRQVEVGTLKEAAARA